MTPLSHRVRWRLLPRASRRLGEAAALLLPPPDEGWRQAVRAFHTQQFQALAAHHRVPFDTYVHDAVDVLKSWAASAVVQIRMDAGDVEQFLRERRYRNQFDTGTSKGALAPGPRMLVEHTALGVPTLARAEHRPVYGYCSGSLETHPNVIKYGDAVLRLRREVNHRTTFTFGDSLDEIAMLSPYPPFCPRPLSRPGTLALDGRYDIRACSYLWQATRCGYIEAQVFGAVTPQDVQEIVFTLKLRPSQSMKEKMLRWGINWRTVPGDEP